MIRDLEYLEIATNPMELKGEGVRAKADAKAVAKGDFAAAAAFTYTSAFTSTFHASSK